MKLHRKLLLLAACALGASTVAAPARAWYPAYANAKWPGNGIMFYINPSMQANQPWAVQAIQEVQGRWYDQPSNFGISTGIDDDFTSATGNGESEIAFTYDWALLCGNGADGCAHLYWDGGSTLTEADIYFDAGQTWTTSTTKTAGWAYGGWARYFQPVVAHEVGHAANLAHENRFYNVMGCEWNHVYTNGANAYAYVGEDATTGARSIYGNWSGSDVGVVHWKRDPATVGEYSGHMRTVIYDANMNVLPSIQEGAEPYFKVSKGQTINVEFTFENNGDAYQSRVVRYYLSTNDLITTIDTHLGGYWMNLYPDTPFTSALTITIPSNLTAGQKYWIGVIVDADGALAEFNENNNAAYVGIKVN